MACFALTRQEEHEELLEVIREKMKMHVVWRHLNFPTTFASGLHFLHLVYEGAVPLVTAERVIMTGETLCQRHGRILPTTQMLPACQGCEAIAAGLVIRELD